MSAGPADTAAARVLTGAALVALGIALAVSGLVWRVDVEPGLLISIVRPPAGGLVAFLACVLSAVGLFVVRDLTELTPSPGLRGWTAFSRLRGAMWSAVAVALLGLLATVAATSDADGPSARHLVGPAGVVVPIALGTGAALALLAASSLYETLYRDRLVPAAVEGAHARLDAVLRPPDVLYYI